MSDQPRRSYAEMNRLERTGFWIGMAVISCIIALVVIAALLILLAPGIIYDWKSERLAGDPEVFLIAAARDGATWVISLMVWAGLGALAWSYRYWPADDISEEDEDFDGMDDDGNEDADW